MWNRESIDHFTEQHREETLELLKTLTSIPAPTGAERERAEYCLNWLCSKGIKGAFTDEKWNVILPFHCDEESRKLVVTAHLDTVFTESTPLKVTDYDEKLYAPGIGDDTANLVNMLMTILYLHEYPKISSKVTNVIFAANVGEEGLGNLCGSRAIYGRYQDKIRAWISFDLYYNGIYDKAVGSCRYEVKVKTKGGHSFGDFGNANAIVELAELIHELNRQQIPEEAKTTFNVGVISGGTSVNTIAQEAKMLYEFRSESNVCLKQMEENFRKILAGYRKSGVTIETALLGVRPGNGDVSETEEEALCQKCIEIMKEYYDGEISRGSASTDCNIPLSEGIPAVTFGTVMGAQLHTTEEWIEKDSMVNGQKMAIAVILDCAGKGNAP